MEVVVLAGGRGTRMGNATNRPKCLVEVGGKPILLHIFDIYAAHGYEDFTVAAGFRYHWIRRWFNQHASPYCVRLINTGPDTQTGGRLRRIAPAETFMATYGDGLGNVDITALVEHHRRCGKLATVTATRPPARFGHLELDGDLVRVFNEKPQAVEGWVNGGFFVLEPRVIDFVAGDDVAFEREPLGRLASAGQLAAYRHEGYWQPMDTMRERELLDRAARLTPPPWLTKGSASAWPLLAR